MSDVLNDELAYQILEIVNEIPEGKVVTYGQIAGMIGRKNNSRLVGKVISKAEYYGDYPCHRVVNHNGRLAPGFEMQEALLKSEGVILKDNGHVDLKKYQWNI